MSRFIFREYIHRDDACDVLHYFVVYFFFFTNNIILNSIRSEGSVNASGNFLKSICIILEIIHKRR